MRGEDLGWTIFGTSTFLGFFLAIVLIVNGDHAKNAAIATACIEAGGEYTNIHPQAGIGDEYVVLGCIHEGESL